MRFFATSSPNLLLIGWITLGWLLPGWAAAAAEPRRPNILYIIVDDQSPFDFKFYNPASTLDAPVIERLAAQGMVLDAAYHMGSHSGAVCVPSRHMLMCGRSVWHLPIGPGKKKCPPGIERFTLAPVFNAAGYDTMRTCKIGNAYEGADALFTVRRDATKRGGTAESGSAWHGEQVLAYLDERERTNDADPFLIYFGFSHPHDTRDGTPELLAKYGATNHTDEATPPPTDPRQPPVPPNWLPKHPFDDTHAAVRDEVDVSGVWGRRDPATIRNEIGREYACSENIDRQIGRVLDKLEAMGELDNTWIFYTADHGIAIGRHGLQGKQNLYEHTWRVPFVVRGPGVKPGSRPPGNIYHESPDGGLHTQLFNVAENPHEMLAEHHDPSVAALLPQPPRPEQKNLATDPAHAATRAEMEALLAAPSAVAADARPNIVLFLADDLGYGELGCYGNAAAITPNLDRFAAEGLKLNDCHSACPVCSPSRAALLTGRHPYRTGVFTWIPEDSPIHLRTSEVTLPKLLREAGYETCHVGKWHLNGKFNDPQQPQPDAHGYSWWLATQNNAAPSHAFPENFVRNGAAIGKADDYSAPFIAKEAVTWLKEKRDASKPFFLAVWTHEPHYPIASDERYEKLHAAIADPVERTYRANVTQLDDAFGMVMKALDEIGAADSTFVFFTSDNGPEGDGVKGPGRGLAGGLRGRKRSTYEGGHRVPGLVRWPGQIEPGTESDRPVIGSDFFPTALAAAGLEPPAGVKLDGVNLVPAMAGKKAKRTVPLYWRWGGFIAYREGDWKIVADEGLEKPELYDLAADRAETRDRAADEADRLAGMLERLRAYTAEIEAEGPDWWRSEGWNKRKN